MRRLSAVIGERPAVRFLLTWLLLFIAGASWAIATPLGASPDEPAHIIKAAAVVRGELLGEPTDAPAVREVIVPRGIADSLGWTCYRRDGTVEATCMGPVSDDWSDAPGITSAGLYNPTYYALVGWPSLVVQDTSAVAMGMRLVNALLTSLFLAVAVAALLKFGRSRIIVATIAAAVTPMVIFLNASVNPNGLEIAAGASLFASLLYLVRRDPEATWRWLVVIAVSGILLAQSRGLSPLWLGLLGLTAIIAARPERLGRLLRSPGVWITIAALIGGMVAAGAWILRTGTLGSMGVFPGAGEVEPPEAFIQMLFNVALDPGYIGIFGWLDAPAPAIAYVTWSFLACILVLVAIAFARGRLLVALAFALLVFFFVPPIVQAASVETSGYIWQGRYALVAYVGVMILAGVAAVEWGASSALGVPRRALRRIDVAVVSIVAFAQAFSLVQATKRYAVGTDDTWSAFFTEPRWLPPLGAYLWPALVAAAFVGLFITLRGREHDDEPMAEPSDREPISRTA